MITMEKKNMYIVIKRDDAKKYLSQEEIHALVNILGKISNGRMDDNKHPDNTYYVCNTNEPYADAVHKVILGGEALKNENMSYCPDACGSISACPTIRETLIICTNKPGWMIGKGGWLYEQYKEKIMKQFKSIKNIEFIETDSWYIR